MVYQFTLPPLLLYSLFSGNAGLLTSWARTIPATGGSRTFLNFTASHDGIGLRPLEGILPEEEVHSLISGIRSFGGLISEKRNADGKDSAYEMNITYLDALSGTREGPDHLQENRFLCSQLIMLALQGIPAVYIQSILGAGNDYAGYEKTGRARSLNRKQWDEATLLSLLAAESPNKRIFTEYSRVINIRKKIAAFHPDVPQQILSCGDSFFALLRESRDKAERIFCISNITARPVTLSPGLIPHHSGTLRDQLAGNRTLDRKAIRFGPYQTRWLYE
jgi:sucrose phosphorylase